METTTFHSLKASMATEEDELIAYFRGGMCKHQSAKIVSRDAHDASRSKESMQTCNPQSTIYISFSIFFSI